MVLDKTWNSEKEVKIVFYKLSKFDKSWLESRIWNQAKALNNVELIVDEDGEIAKLFGAKTLGHIGAYNK